MIFSTDIDIDFKDRSEACAVVEHIPASMRNKGQLTKHPSGIYLQDIPRHPFLGCSALTYGDAELNGYFKIDFLSNSVYEGVRDKNHLIDLMNREVPWDLFLDKSVVSRLSHIHNHYGIVKHIQPRSVDDLSVVLALLRPGKKHLCFQPREVIFREIWEKSGDAYLFKRAHAVAYAVSIVVQLQLLIERIGAEIDQEEEFVFPV